MAYGESYRPKNVRPFLVPPFLMQCNVKYNCRLPADYSYSFWVFSHLFTFSRRNENNQDFLRAWAESFTFEKPQK